MKNVELTRKFVAARLSRALVQLHSDIGGLHDPDYDVLAVLSITVLRGEPHHASKKPAGVVLLEELVEYIMERLGHVTQLTASDSGMARAARATSKQLRG